MRSEGARGARETWAEAMSFGRSLRPLIERERRLQLAASGETGTGSLPAPRVEPSTVRLVVRGRIGSVDAAALCERVRRLLAEGPAELVVCDVRAVTDPDLGTVEVVARLALTARRLGSRIELRYPCSALRQLLALTGLDAVAPWGPELTVEAEGQPEHGEQPFRVEEERDPADPVA